jgi:hypothetical protein
MSTTAVLTSSVGGLLILAFLPLGHLSTSMKYNQMAAQNRHTELEFAVTDQTSLMMNSIKLC